MTRGSSLLILAWLCLLMAGPCGLAMAAEPASPEVLAAREALEADPVLLEEIEQYEIAWEAWQEGLSCQLLQGWQPPLVRLHAVNVEFPMILRERELPLQCQQWAEPVDADRVRQQVLRDGWNQPAVLMNVFWSVCFRNDSPEWCDRQAIFAQLRMLEPDNAAVQLLPLLSRHFTELVLADDAPGRGVKIERMRKIELEQHNDNQEKRMLAAAAAGARFDLHYAAGTAATYQATEGYLKRHPAPEPSPMLEMAMAEAEIALPAPGELYMLRVFANATASSPAYQDLLNTCSGFVEAGQEPVIEHCLAIAGKMQQASTMIVQSIGQALARNVANPEPAGAMGEGEDPERWKQRFRAIVASCQESKLLLNFRYGYSMPAAHNRAFYSDLEQLGEQQAYLQAAIREYAVYPELFDADPASCARAYELDEATQRELVELYETRDADWPDNRRASLQLLMALTEP